MSKKIIKNGKIVTAVDEFIGDILIDGEKIVEIGKDLNLDGAEIIDAEGYYVLPGGVDTHVHFSFDYRGNKVRGFDTSNAAVAGGTTTVVEFVNQVEGKSIVDSVEEYEKNEVLGVAMADYNFHGVATDFRDTRVFDEISKLPDAGIPTLKLFMAYKGAFYHANDEAVFRALQAAKDCGVTVMVHAENADVIDVLQKQLYDEGITEPYGHALSRPPYVEVEATERAINLAKLAEAPLYVAHVSAKGSSDAIQKANSEGYSIFGETCTHYLTQDREELAKPNFEGAKYVCSPALRTEEHREALWDAVDRGWLNTITSDHCGFDWKDQKHFGKDNFANIPNGCPGLQDRLAVLWTYGVDKGKITPSQLVDLYATTPAKVHGLDYCKGHLGVGYDADIVLYNPNSKSTMSNDNSLHQVDYNPYEGWEQVGNVETVYLRGEKVVEDSKYIGKKGQGKRIKGKAYGLTYRGFKK